MMSNVFGRVPNASVLKTRVNKATRLYDIYRTREIEIKRVIIYIILVINTTENET